MLAVLGNPGATVLASTMRFLLDRRADWVEICSAVAARLLAGADADRTSRRAPPPGHPAGSVPTLPVWLSRGAAGPDTRHLA